MNQTMDFLAPLDDLAVLRIAGDDARAFLHAQLSNDIEGMSANDARLAAYCSPKGRMLGSLVIWAESHAADSPLLALVKADIVEALTRRLRMFILRSKVSIELSALKAYGASSATSAAASSAVVPANEAAADLAPAPAWQVRRAGTHTLVSAPTANTALARWWVIADSDQSIPELASLLGLEARPAAVWQAQEIEAGLGWVEAANQELFIPQSLNFDLNGGVSFTKGCYPGQEVVARAHFRGTVKRRAVPGYCRLPVDGALAPGEDIFDASRPASPAGRVINAVILEDEDVDLRQCYVFMEINVGDLDQADFRALSAQGPALRVLPLPYALESKTE